MIAALWLPSTAQARKHCSDFHSQRSAQRFYRDHSRAKQLDHDRDGLACENRPCPCTRRWHDQHDPLPCVILPICKLGF